MKAERESLAFENLGYSGGSNNVVGQADLGEEVASNSAAARNDVNGDVNVAERELVTFAAVQVAVRDEESEEKCSWGPLEPPCCRPLLNIKMVLLVLCLISAMQSMMVNGFVNVSITSVEKRFDIDSTDAGLIASTYDIATVLCLIPVGYWGGHGSKPRWLGFGTLIMGVGALVYALPHYTTGLYKYTTGIEDEFCDVSLNATNVCSKNLESSLWQYKYVLYLGQLLIGIGATPLYTLGLTYLDENLSAQMSSVYMGIFYAIAVIGPAVGFILGGYFISLFTDFDRVTDNELDIDEDSEAWVGAWWLGPLICSGLLVLVAFPMLGFPRRLPGWQEIAQQKESEAHGGLEDSTPVASGLQSLKEFPRAVKRLLTNPTFMFINFGGAFEAILVSGLGTFLPKYLESQFSLTSSTAAIYVGITIVPAGGGGMLLGGYVVKHFNLKVRGILKLIIGLNVAVLVLALVFLVRCENVDFAGVSVTYNGRTMNRDASESTLKDACNTNCSCTYDTFAPVCGDDDVMYFNPCVAGCLVWDERSSTDRYDNCSCVAQSSGGRHQGAKEGKCSGDCNLLGFFLPILGLTILLAFATDVPAVSATLRCVPDKQRSFAVSLQWIILRCLGSIPGPIIFGAAIDDTCIFTKKDCDGDAGACYYYDNDDMSTYFLVLALVCKVGGTIMFILSCCLYKPPPLANEAIDIADDSGATSGTAAGVSNPCYTGREQAAIAAVDLDDVRVTPAQQTDGYTTELVT